MGEKACFVGLAVKGVSLEYEHSLSGVWQEPGQSMSE